MKLESFLDSLEQYTKITQTIGIKELDEYILNNSVLNLIFYDNKENLKFTSKIQYDLKKCDFKKNTILDIDYLSLNKLNTKQIKEIYNQLLKNNTSLTFIVKTPDELEGITKDLTYKLKNFELLRMLSFFAKYENNNLFLIKSVHTRKGKIGFLRDNLFESKYNIFENDKFELGVFYLMTQRLKEGRKIHYYTNKEESQFLLNICNLLLNKRPKNKTFNEKEKDELLKYSNLIIKFDDSQDIENLFISEVPNFVYDYPNYRIKDETITISLNHTMVNINSATTWKKKEIDDCMSLFIKSNKKLEDNSIWSMEYQNEKIVLASNSSKFALLLNTNKNLSHSVYGPINIPIWTIDEWSIVEDNNEFLLFNQDELSRYKVGKIKSLNLDENIILCSDNKKYKLGKIDQNFVDYCLKNQITLRSLEYKINYEYK